MSDAKKAPHGAMVERYERLKKQYFNSAAMRRHYDDDGEEIPQALDRTALIQQFENMGVEIPLSPDYPLTPVPRKPE